MPTEPMRARKYNSRPKDQAMAWQRQLRRDLWPLLHLEDLVEGPQSIALDARVTAEERRDGYLLQHLELNSTPSRRMPALLTLPAGDESTVPAVVCIHGHSGDRFAVHDDDSIYAGLAPALSRGGYATLAVDVGQHEVYEDGRTLMGERLWDLMRCVDYLQSVPQVDDNRLGCAGLSLGGEMAMWLGAMDERIAAEVSAGFLTTMDQMEHNHCLCWKFDGLRELVDYADIYALTAPRPLMRQNGLLEPESQFHVPLAGRALEEIIPIYRDLGSPRNIALHVHGGGHEIDLPALLTFFDHHLGGHAAAWGGPA